MLVTVNLLIIFIKQTSLKVIVDTNHVHLLIILSPSPSMKSYKATTFILLWYINLPILCALQMNQAQETHLKKQTERVFVWLDRVLRRVQIMKRILGSSSSEKNKKRNNVSPKSVLPVFAIWTLISLLLQCYNIPIYQTISWYPLNDILCIFITFHVLDQNGNSKQ